MKLELLFLLQSNNEGIEASPEKYQTQLKQIFDKSYEKVNIIEALSEIVFEEPEDEVIIHPEDHIEGL